MTEATSRNWHFRRGRHAAARRRPQAVPDRLARAMDGRGFAVETAESVEEAVAEAAAPIRRPMR